MRTILITGANGMLGKEACIMFKEAGYNVIGVDIDDFDITDRDAVESYLGDLKFDYILHTAAYTDVELAETKEMDCWAVNYWGTLFMSLSAERKDVPIIYISTDYVFDGKRKTPYKACSKRHPINKYGKSKSCGEHFISQFIHKHYIVRTSWLYGKYGKNFVDTMAKKQEYDIKVVDDQRGCPTYTKDLVNAILKIINTNNYGTYNVSGGGSITWFKFAKEIYKYLGIKKNLIPIETDNSKVKRPRYSVLKNSVKMPAWQNSLKSYLEENYYACSN